MMMMMLSRSSFLCALPFSPIRFRFFSSSRVLPYKPDTFHDHHDHPTVIVPKEKLMLHFSRSGGPGGQNVNKVSTKVDLRFNIETAEWIPEEVKARLKEKFPNRINQEGEFFMNSSRFRTQTQNIRDAIEKLQEMIDEACIPPSIVIICPLFFFL